MKELSESVEANEKGGKEEKQGERNRELRTPPPLFGSLGVFLLLPLSSTSIPFVSSSPSNGGPRGLSSPSPPFPNPLAPPSYLTFGSYVVSLTFQLTDRINREVNVSSREI